MKTYENVRANTVDRAFKLILMAACLAVPQIVTAQSMNSNDKIQNTSSSTESQVTSTTVDFSAVTKTQGNQQNRSPDSKPFLMKQEQLDQKKFQRGGSDSGGGDEVGISFQQTVQSAAMKLSSAMAPATKENLAEIIASSKYVVVDQELFVKIDGASQDSTAINVPKEKMIYVNRNRWSAIQNQSQREALAAHEVLSLMGLESTGDYHISSKLVDSDMITGPNSPDLLNIENLKKAWLTGEMPTAKSLEGNWAQIGGVTDRSVDMSPYNFSDAPYDANARVSEKFGHMKDPISGEDLVVNKATDKALKRETNKVYFDSQARLASFSAYTWHWDGGNEIIYDKFTVYNCRHVTAKPKLMVCAVSLDGAEPKSYRIDNVICKYLLLEKR